MPELIERVRVGSHREFHPRINYETGKPDEKGRGWNETIEDFKTVYHNSLVSKDWLKEHEHDLDNFEATIDITVDGGKSISINGNYKAGMIRNFLAEYKPAKQSKIKTEA